MAEDDVRPAQCAVGADVSGGDEQPVNGVGDDVADFLERDVIPPHARGAALGETGLLRIERQLRWAVVGGRLRREGRLVIRVGVVARADRARRIDAAGILRVHSVVGGGSCPVPAATDKDGVNNRRHVGAGRGRAKPGAANLR